MQNRKKAEEKRLDDLKKKKAAEEKKKKTEIVTEKTACGSGQRVFYPVCTKKTYIDNCRLKIDHEGTRL